MFAKTHREYNLLIFVYFVSHDISMHKLYSEDCAMFLHLHCNGPKTREVAKLFYETITCSCSKYKNPI